MSSWPCAGAPRALMELSARRIMYSPEGGVLSFFVLCVLRAPRFGTQPNGSTDLGPHPRAALMGAAA